MLSVNLRAYQCGGVEDVNSTALLISKRLYGIRDGITRNFKRDWSARIGHSTKSANLSYHSFPRYHRRSNNPIKSGGHIIRRARIGVVFVGRQTSPSQMTIIRLNDSWDITNANDISENSPIRFSDMHLRISSSLISSRSSSGSHPGLAERRD